MVCKGCYTRLPTGAVVCEVCGKEVVPQKTVQKSGGKSCPHCGEENKEGRLFCGSCRKRLDADSIPQKKCPHCGEQVDQWRKFCTTCRNRIAPKETTPVKDVSNEGPPHRERATNSVSHVTKPVAAKESTSPMTASSPTGSSLTREAVEGEKSCEQCGCQLVKGKNFCPECGKNFTQPLPKFTYCLYCGTDLEPKKPFCSECGTRAGQISPEGMPRKRSRNLSPEILEELAPRRPDMPSERVSIDWSEWQKYLTVNNIAMVSAVFGLCLIFFLAISTSSRIEDTEGGMESPTQMEVSLSDSSDPTPVVNISMEGYMGTWYGEYWDDSLGTCRYIVELTQEGGEIYATIDYSQDLVWLRAMVYEGGSYLMPTEDIRQKLPLQAFGEGTYSVYVDSFQGEGDIGFSYGSYIYLYTGSLTDLALENQVGKVLIMEPLEMSGLNQSAIEEYRSVLINASETYQWYTYLDLDKDGIFELLLAEKEFGGYVTTIYSYSETGLHCITDSHWTEGEYMLFEDGLLLLRNDNQLTTFQLVEGELVMLTDTRQKIYPFIGEYVIAYHSLPYYKLNYLREFFN